MRKKGFTLFEVLIAASLLGFVASSVAGLSTYEHAWLVRASHKLQAVYFASGQADYLLTLDPSSSDLSLGTHTGTLPACYFTQQLNGQLTYLAYDIILPAATARAVRVTVSWTETSPVTLQLSENLYTIVYCY